MDTLGGTVKNKRIVLFVLLLIGLSAATMAVVRASSGPFFTPDLDAAALYAPVENPLTVELVDSPIQSIAQQDIVCYVYDWVDGSDPHIQDVLESVRDSSGTIIAGGCFLPSDWKTGKIKTISWYSTDKALGQFNTYSCEVDLAMTATRDDADVWRCGSMGG